VAIGGLIPASYRQIVKQMAIEVYKTIYCFPSKMKKRKGTVGTKEMRGRNKVEA